MNINELLAVEIAKQYYLGYLEITSAHLKSVGIVHEAEKLATIHYKKWVAVAKNVLTLEPFTIKFKNNLAKTLCCEYYKGRTTMEFKNTASEMVSEIYIGLAVKRLWKEFKVEAIRAMEKIRHVA